MLPQPTPQQPDPSVQSLVRQTAKRRSQMDRIASAHLGALGNTLGETVGQGPRQQLVWLGLLAMPLLFPIALPGMASVVGTFCLLVALGLCKGRPVQLPAWLAKRTLSVRAKTMLARMIHRVLFFVARMGQPRMISLSRQPARGLNGFMLGVAGLTMVVPVPVVTFDNVLPALAITLISWGLRLRDGRMILAGYGVTVMALISVMLLWWGGTVAATNLIRWASS